jgi:alkylhydroperoxidase family enzyme
MSNLELNTDRPRIMPLEAPFTSEVAEELARWQGNGSAPIALFRTLVHHLPLAGAMYPLGFYFLGRTAPLAIRDREIVIDRVCARCGCEYEWGVHARIFAKTAGLDADQLTATAAGGADASCWSESDGLLIRMVDELHDSGRISDSLWASMAARWSSEELMNLVVLAGWYHAISFIANAARVPLEEFGLRFPNGSSEHRL